MITVELTSQDSWDLHSNGEVVATMLKHGGRYIVATTSIHRSPELVIQIAMKVNECQTADDNVAAAREHQGKVWSNAERG